MNGEGDLYSDRQVAFVSGHNGTTQMEVIWVNLIGPVSILLRNLAIPWLFVGRRFASGRIKDTSLKLLLDFIFTIMPTVLVMGSWSGQARMVCLAEILCVLSLLLFCFCEYVFISRDKPKLRDVINHVTDDQRRPMFFTYFRAVVLISTGVAILAVDFPVFPRRFAKTELYGHSVMDVGTACFVYITALTSSDVRKHADHHDSAPPRLLARLRSALPLTVIGVGRSLIIKAIGYHEHVTEYGIHWNFFITLASIRIITILIARVISLRRFAWLLALVFGLGYQYMLSEYGLERWIMSEQTGRDGLIAANREGICSLFGYLSLYFAAAQVGAFMARTGIRLKSWFWRVVQLAAICVAIFGLQLISEANFGQPSRRLANLSYVLTMLLFNTGAVAVCLLVEVISLFGAAAKMPLFSVDENPFDQLRPCMLTAINHRPLVYFMAANLLTGVVNFLMKTIDVTNEFEATLIISAYSFILSVIVMIGSRHT
uniref:Phosphatidylinositol-glycan biosynthesis class W protein n=1 Tax=Plectus sambesii TaxID=2011161 RepID=A0A914VQN9_9BILA